LLRLHLPLDGKIHCGSPRSPSLTQELSAPHISSGHPIGRCDGRCVQRAGT